MKKSLLPAFAFCSLLLLTQALPALAAEDKGVTIAKEMQNRDSGWGDSQSEMKMVLRSPNGRENVRMIKIKNLEMANDGDKNLMVFDEPKDVAGTAFLSFSHNNAANDQWIYLPALKRIKRIASNKKTGSFMGSEFSYEDLQSFEIAQYDFKYLRDENMNGEKCFVIESYPKDKFSGYSKLVSWIDQSHYRVQKIEFYDLKKNLLKVMTPEKYELLDGKYWRPTISSMKNQQNGKSTNLYWTNIRLKTGLTEDDFSQNNLKRTN